MLITEEYREQQRQMHEKYNYGTASIGYAPMVANIINKYQVSELLDYGAGRLNLMKAIANNKLVNHQFRYIPYEPSNPEFAEKPENAEMVACIDVLEHIEPDCLDDVLDDLKRVTDVIGFFSIATTPAAKTLPDGRNAHLIVEPMEWWLPKLMSRFDIHTLQRSKEGFFVIVAARPKILT